MLAGGNVGNSVFLVADMVQFGVRGGGVGNGDHADRALGWPMKRIATGACGDRRGVRSRVTTSLARAADEPRTCTTTGSSRRQQTDAAEAYAGRV
ncbi:MAG: hypothetical protein R3B49_09350 [Phycisphaerales bacterium]